MIKTYEPVKSMENMDTLHALKSCSLTFYPTGSQLDPNFKASPEKDLDFFTVDSVETQKFLLASGFVTILTPDSAYQFDFTLQGVERIMRYIPIAVKDSGNYKWIDVQFMKPWSYFYKINLHKQLGYISKQTFPLLYSLLTVENALSVAIARKVADEGLEYPFIQDIRDLVKR